MNVSLRGENGIREKENERENVGEERWNTERREIAVHLAEGK